MQKRRRFTSDLVAGLARFVCETGRGRGFEASTRTGQRKASERPQGRISLPFGSVGGREQLTIRAQDAVGERRQP
jgi:hypothetical protein